MDKIQITIVLLLLQSFGTILLQARTTGGQCPSGPRTGLHGKKCKINCLSNADCAGEMICCKVGCWFTCQKPDRGQRVPPTDDRIQIQTRGENEEEEEEEAFEEETEEQQGKRAPTKCEQKRAKRLKSKRIGIFVPECKKNGQFRRVQCNARRRSCWCVDSDGKKISGTNVRGGRRPKCKAVGCGRRNFYNANRRSKRVVGGGESIAGSWPWQAALLFNKTKLWCGGSLIKNGWIATAAHCFSDKSSQDPSKWIIRMGEHSLSAKEGQEKDYSVRKIYIHPGYILANDSHPGDNDIALIHLTKPVAIKRHINKICLPSGKPYLNPGTRCVVTGWGKTRWNGTISPHLREGHVDFVSRNKCNSIKSHAGKVSPNFLCAGFKEGGIDACKYDGGGPLACPAKSGRWVLSGIVSWTRKCGQPHKYGVYTNVSKYLSWIRRRWKNN